MNIRPMEQRDKERVIEMMRTFYTSPAVWSDGSEEIFAADVEHCIGDDPFVEGYVFETEGTLCGYAMLAKSFSTEFGRHCIWIEDIYLQKPFRGMGFGGAFLQFVEEKYPHHLLRLEVEEDNTPALHVYKRQGYDVLPYMEMKKLTDQ